MSLPFFQCEQKPMTQSSPAQDESEKDTGMLCDSKSRRVSATKTTEKHVDANFFLEIEAFSKTRILATFSDPLRVVAVYLQSRSLCLTPET